MTLVSGVAQAADINAEFDALYNTVAAENRAGVRHNLNFRSSSSGTLSFTYTPPDDEVIVVMGVSVYPATGSPGLGTIAINATNSTGPGQLSGASVTTALHTSTGEKVARGDFRAAPVGVLVKGVSYTITLGDTVSYNWVSGFITLQSRRRPA